MWCKNWNENAKIEILCLLFIIYRGAHANIQHTHIHAQIHSQTSRTLCVVSLHIRNCLTKQRDTTHWRKRWKYEECKKQETRRENVQDRRKTERMKCIIHSATILFQIIIVGASYTGKHQDLHNPVQHVQGVLWNLLLAVHSWNTPTKRWPGGILVRFPLRESSFPPLVPTILLFWSKPKACDCRWG